MLPLIVLPLQTPSVAYSMHEGAIPFIARIIKGILEMPYTLNHGGAPQSHIFSNVFCFFPKGL